MTSCTARRAVLLALACSWALPAQAADYAAERAKMAAAPAKDAVLVQLQAGLAGLSEGRTQESGALFDTALATIEGMFANTENAARARSLWYEEGAKDFKGEPYERAMAFHYRGLLYLAEGDYENARASFRGGVLQDAFAEEQQNRSDFASLMLLEGWSNQLNGDTEMAADAYREVARLRPGFTAPAAKARLLIVAELGGSPRKLGDGIANSEIVYRRAKRTPEQTVTVTVSGKPYAVPLVEDVFFQASTRGGRPIDRIIDGKVAFQNVTEKVGSVLGTLAAEGSLLQAAYGSSGYGNKLGALAAVGAISSIISANVKPKADVRYWANLPDNLHLLAVEDGPGPHEVQVQLFDEAGNAVASDKIQVQQWRDPKGNGLLWIKTRN